MNQILQNIFVQYGDRNARKNRHMALMLNKEENFVPTEMVGPASFEVWLTSWKVFANTLILLGEVDVGTLDEYEKYHRRFHDRFGDKCWGLHYQAETRGRREQLARIRRRAETEYDAALTAHTPHRD